MHTHRLHIVCARTNTLVGRCIRAMTSDDVNHCAIYLDCDIDSLYSFRRETRYNLLSGKFGTETLSDMARGSTMYYMDTEIILSAREFKRLKRMLKFFHRHRYRYNYAALFLLKLNLGMKNQRNMVCSTFAAYIVSQIIDLDDPFYRYTPIKLSKELKMKFPTKTICLYYND